MAERERIAAFLQEPSLGTGLSDEMARCEAREALASGRLSDKLVRAMTAKPGIADDRSLSDEESGQLADVFADVFADAERACIKQMSD